jgi:AcrR family transcriptional regulator
MADTARRRPGPVRSLSREQVIATGLEVMAGEGLRNVSFRAIGIRLGVDPKALYTYVADKDDLLAGMFDAALATLDLPQHGDPRPPAEQLVAMFISLRRHLVANADLFHLRRPPSLLGGDFWVAMDRIWAVVTSLVPNDARAARLYMNLVEFTVGSAITAGRPVPDSPAVERALARLDPATYPHLRSFARAVSAIDHDLAFETTVRTLLQAAIAQK